MGDLPGAVENLKMKSKKTTQDIADANAELTESRLLRAKTEGQIQVLNDKLKKYQNQVYSVTTNKEYDAISTEIEAAEKMIEETENQVIALLEKEDVIVQQIKLFDELIVEIKKEFDAKNQLLNDKLKENEVETLRLKHERELSVRQIEKPLLNIYERIRKRYPGSAVAQVSEYCCGECFAQIPVQTVVEIRQMNRIIHCETCGRILISLNSKK